MRVTLYMPTRKCMLASFTGNGYYFSLGRRRQLPDTIELCAHPVPVATHRLFTPFLFPKGVTGLNNGGKGFFFVLVNGRLYFN